jgi:hypothetical protein
MRWLFFALVFWLSLCNPYWPILIAAVYLMPAVFFAYLQRLLQDQSSLTPQNQFDSGLVILTWAATRLSHCGHSITVLANRMRFERLTELGSD